MINDIQQINMKVLVTGHLGYIGSVMVPILLSADFDVTGLDAGFYQESPLNQGATAKNFKQLQGDIRNIATCQLTNFDAVIHLAGISYDRLGQFDQQLTTEINSQATIDLARKAKQAGVSRFLFASSCSVYGTSLDTDLNEDAVLNPLSPYAKSKAISEEQLNAIASSNFSPVSLRNASAYGVSPSFRADLVLNNFVGWAKTSQKIRLSSDGLSWRPLPVQQFSHERF